MFWGGVLLYYLKLFAFLDHLMVVTNALKDQDLSFSSDNIPYFGHLGKNDRNFCYSSLVRARIWLK